MRRNKTKQNKALVSHRCSLTNQALPRHDGNVRVGIYKHDSLPRHAQDTTQGRDFATVLFFFCTATNITEGGDRARAFAFCASDSLFSQNEDGGTAGVAGAAEGTLLVIAVWVVGVCAFSHGMNGMNDRLPRQAQD